MALGLEELVTVIFLLHDSGTLFSFGSICLDSLATFVRKVSEGVWLAVKIQWGESLW